MAEIWTIGKILKWTEEYFQKYNIENPRLDAEVLLGYVLNKERIFLYVHFDQPLDSEELAKFKECIKKRAMKMPVAYITGVREFMGLDFKVTEATLIPRPDTEILVETAMERLGKIAGNEAGTGKCFADLGTGSGAICLSILNYMKEIEAVTVDISPKAIAVAKENAEKFAVSDRIEFLEGDFLKPLENKGKFTAILSNPPYIPKQDILGLESDVKDFEPMGALDGGIDGLDFYRQLLVKSANYIEDGGFLAIEIGINQSQAILEMAKRNLMWGKVEVIKDLAGIDRCVVLWKK
ncbi:MAG: peptide chain release factor N(5)-glutamine methyltransferase [Selenomonadaceae bacterium]|nr:peptide chain release factor N(5)-glutamine methyltransferase [Selenomonadaceae bacterium]